MFFFFYFIISPRRKIIEYKSCTCVMYRGRCIHTRKCIIILPKGDRRRLRRRKTPKAIAQIGLQTSHTRVRRPFKWVFNRNEGKKKNTLGFYGPKTSVTAAARWHCVPFSPVMAWGTLKHYRVEKKKYNGFSQGSCKYAIQRRRILLYFYHHAKAACFVQEVGIMYCF